MDEKKNKTLAKIGRIFRDGLITQNPVLIQLLGMCSVLAISTSAQNGLGMGLAVTFVLTGSNIVISLIRSAIPNKIRIASFVVVISGFVTAIDLIIKAYLPSLSKSLGIFIPLIVVNCIILARAESFASKNNPFLSALDGISMGLGYTIVIVIMSAIREILGFGTILGYDITKFIPFEPALMMVLPPGGFLILGLLIALVQKITQKGDAK